MEYLLLQNPLQYEVCFDMRRIRKLYVRAKKERAELSAYFFALFLFYGRRNGYKNNGMMRVKETEVMRMRAKTIETIGELLTNRKESAYMDYITIRRNLEEKYNTEWLDKVATKQEIDILNAAKHVYWELNEMCDDFKQHQW